MNSPTKLELLAPAKNIVVGKAAINHGADAVYIGAPGFGARKQAANSLEDIEQLIKYAHIYNSKVFIALNTILFDKELKTVQNLIQQLYQIGADAIIIQDMGILEMDLPPIPIHASTQANNYSLEQVRFLENIGLARAVLARELSLNEIKRISNNTNIELEAFIHGALCVSLSGQCYLSQSIGKRSANRGECGQSCRLKYNLTNQQNQTILRDKHLLSLKDFSVGEKIVQLAEAGIKSFKIEGRLKDEAYVKNVLSYYRKILDKLIEFNSSFEKDSSGAIYPKFTADINKSFNRRFTNYFLSGRDKKMASFNSPKSFGEPLGKVIESKKNQIKIGTKEIIANGDGLCFIDHNSELRGVRVEKNLNGLLILSESIQIKKGTLIYRNYNHVFSKELDKSNNIRKIDCFVEIYEEENELFIKITDEDGDFVKSKIEEAKEKAKKQEMIIKMFEKQFLNISDDFFRIKKFAWKVKSEIGFYRISEVNQYRRELLAELLEFRKNNYKPLNIQFKPNNIEFYKTNVDYKFNISNRLAAKFYARHGANVLEESPEITEKYLGKELMTTRYCIKYELGICEKKQLKKPLVDNEKLFIENKFGKYELEFDCGACMMFVKKA